MGDLICSKCGSHDFVKQGEYIVCENCGKIYSLEMLNNPNKDVDGHPPKAFESSDNKKITNLFILAEREYNNRIFQKLKVYMKKS